MPEAEAAQFLARHAAALVGLLGRRPALDAALRDLPAAFAAPTLAFAVVEALYRCVPADLIRTVANAGFAGAAAVGCGVQQQSRFALPTSKNWEVAGAKGDRRQDAKAIWFGSYACLPLPTPARLW